ncbi:MAG: ABC transporter permease [Granulosicoccus sp.]|nr:ABC transporter permease [Granulosicoccus sp.]
MRAKITRVWLLAVDEVMRLLSTRRGLLSLLGFALLWVAVMYYGILPAASWFSGASETGLSDLILPRFGLEAWQKWPAPELAVYWIVCLYLLPFLAVLTAADQTASDRSRGTLRYLSLRSSRLQIYMGRFLGQCIILTLVVLLSLASVIVIVAFNTPEKIQAVFASSPMIITNLVLLLLPYIALMALVSAMARSARQATLYAMILWIGVSLLVAFIQSRFGGLAVLDWVLPGSQVKQLVQLSDWQSLSLAPIPLVHTTVLLIVGGFIMQWRDL